MPKRTDIETVLIIGAGPIIIGQACEFDYSGVQACKALRAEGYRIVLVNSNPATIMTDPDFADATYIEPIEWRTVEKVIEAERPDVLLPTMGGQTALNCALDLNRHGVLRKHNVEIIGATVEAIDKAEDRQLFRRAMRDIGLSTVRGGIAHSLSEAQEVLRDTGFPSIIRPSFTLGGTGGGVAYNAAEFDEICARGLDASPTRELLVEESIIGWKEFEMEVVRDKCDNCIIICSIENLDPMGIHTGDSITVAPAQTLTDKEYQRMRDASIAVLREIGVDTGGSNVQFAVNPDNGRMVVIEMNPRVSRSSALASKATGFPIAKIAAKLAVGYTLDELRNDITGGATPASFEPSIDYIVTKIPRFDFEKFPRADATLTTQMKSVGEVMAIGRTFAESLHKALRSLEIGADGLDERPPPSDENNPNDYREAQLRVPSADRIWQIAQALREGMSIDEVHALCKIDRWFLAQLAELVECEEGIVRCASASASDSTSASASDDVNSDSGDGDGKSTSAGASTSTSSLDHIAAIKLRNWKRLGFSDRRLATLLRTDEDAVRNRRRELDIHPIYKRVDSCAAEFESATAYLYSSYDDECESAPSDNKKIIILGGGPNRIGQGIEFDYCCVHAAMALREDGFETIMVNCNPETVSTDYDTSDRLYFEPLTLEDVLEIIRIEKPLGVIVQYGGQTPLKLARALQANGAPIIGTSPQSIHRAEDRAYFQQLLAELNLRQPPNRTASRATDAVRLGDEIGYPLVVRPSYVLGGRAMEIVHNADELRDYMNSAAAQFDSPVLLDLFLSGAIEIDVDAVCDGDDVLIGGIMEHIEEAGVHSGDSACSLPPFSLSDELQAQLREYTRQLAHKLSVVGLMNVQYAVKDNAIYILEVNPRAARTVPFVSKASAMPLAKIAARCMTGQSLRAQDATREQIPPFYSVKEAVFPFIKFPGVDTVLGPEMKSTGEVMGIGASYGEAFGKAQKAVGLAMPRCGRVLISLRTEDQIAVQPTAAYLANAGFELFATEGTAATLRDANLEVTRVNKVEEGRPHVVDMIKNDEFALIINTTAGKKSLRDSYTIRREALQHKVTYFTTLPAARAAIAAHACGESLGINRLQSLHRQLETK